MLFTSSLCFMQARYVLIYRHQPIMLLCYAAVLKIFTYYAYYAQKFCHSSNVLLLSVDNDKLWLMNNWLNVKSTRCALRIVNYNNSGMR